MTRLFQGLDATSESPIESADFALVLRAITRYASGLGVSEHQAEEIAQEVIVETFRRRRASSSASEVDRPAAYLFWTARNRVIDAHRRAQARDAAAHALASLEGADRYSAEDDAVAGLLQRNASAAAVEHALRAASAADDTMAVRIIGAWLELAEATGSEPSSREVADRAGVSHTSVNQGLLRIRSYFPETEAETSME